MKTESVLEPVTFWEKYLSLTQQMSALIAKNNHADVMECFREFQKLTPEEQKKLCSHLEVNLELSRKVLMNPRVLTNLESVREFLRSMNGYINEDLFSLIQEEDVTEIYDLEGRLIFRTWNSAEATGYSPTDFFILPWYMLYHRDDQINKTYKYIFRELQEQMLVGIVNLRQYIPAHYMHEMLCSPPRSVKIESQYISPVTKSYGSTIGYIHTLKVLDWQERTN